jgi:hypothetical protein
MEIFSKYSRLGYGILLVLLILSIAGVYLSLHNELAQAKVNIPMLAILLTVLSMALAIGFYQMLASTANQSSKYAQQLDQLKKSIQESKKQNEQENVNETVVVDDTVIDYDAEAKSLIPTQLFETQEQFIEKLLSNIAKKHDIVQAIAFNKDETTKIFSFQAAYAYFSENDPPKFIEGETLPGQVAKNKVVLNLNEVPEDYITILSGLGKGSPKHMLILPVLNRNNDCIGIIELASFKAFENQKVKLFETLGHLVCDHLLTIGNSTNDKHDNA